MTTYVEGLALDWAREDPLEMTTGYDGQEVSAVIIGRPGTDEWTVLFDDGAEAWRDQSQLRISDRI